MDKISIYLLILLLVLSVLGIMISIFALIKNEVTYRRHRTIAMAIYEYELYCLDHDLQVKVTYNDMESYDDTFKRFWDFGLTRILPKEKFDIIKWFIET